MSILKRFCGQLLLKEQRNGILRTTRAWSLFFNTGL